MSYVDDAFANLKHNLEITQTERGTAVRRHTTIRDFVTSRWDLIDDFLTGSYRRDTKTKKLKDIDIFIVIDPEGAQADYRTRPPADLLDALETLIADRCPGAHRDGMAVVITYGNDDEVMSIDVVPAFDRKGGGYYIPDPAAGTWIATNPKRHHELSIAKNAECYGKFVPFVKMIKGINRELGEPVSPSFLLEVMAQALVQAPFGRYQDEIVLFLATAAEQIGDQWDDPAGQGGDVNTVMGTGEKAGRGRCPAQRPGNRRACRRSRGRRAGTHRLRRVEEAVWQPDDEAMTVTAPRGIPGRPIHERQLDQDMVRLQRAAAASHQRGQLIEAIRVDAAITLAAAGIVVTLAGHGRTAVSIIGAAWFVVSAFFLRRAAATTARQGALLQELQELFDTQLFYLPWRSTVAGEQVPEPDVAQLARRLQPGSSKDQGILAGWYDPTDGVHHPYDVLIAQEQNLGWDARLRRRYAALVLAAAVIWSGLGLIAGIGIADATIVGTLLSFFIPSLAIYQITLEIWTGQQRVAAERQRLNDTVTTELRNARPGPISNTDWHRLREVARDIQDGILRTRLDVSRVPEWFYRRYRNRDELDFADTAEGHRRRLSSQP